MLPAANPTVIFKELADGAVLFAPSVEIYFGLNEVGARVWQLLPPGCESLDELCAKLGSHYPDVSAATIRSDVMELLDQLVEQGLAVPPATPRHDASANASRTS
jgi:hypothetical protein